jgi:uncharacterized protein YyaL (SSP411 family)
VLNRMAKEGLLMRRYASGEAALPGTLEDYAFFVQGLIDLFEADGGSRWLQEALTLHEKMMELFWDDKDGGLFFTSAGEEGAPARIKIGQDGPTPSGSSVAALNAIRLGELAGKPEMKERADDVLRVFHEDIVQQPPAHTYMLCVLDLLVQGTKELVVTAPDLESAHPMVTELNRRFAPDLVLVVATRETYDTIKRLTTLLEGREPGATATAYLCENYACKLPVTTPEGLRKELDANTGGRQQPS